MSRSAIRLVTGIFTALVLVAGAAGVFVWWKVSGLKETLVRDLEKSIGAQVQVTTLDLDLWKGELHAADITLINDRSSTPWQKGTISQATVHFHLRDVFDPTLPVTVEVSSWSLVLEPHAATFLPPATESQPAAPASSPSEPSPATAPGAPSVYSRHHIRVTQLSAQEGSVEVHLFNDKEISVHGVAFQASDNESGTWTTQLQASSITAGSLEAGAGSVQLRSEPDKIVFSNLRLACGQGFISGDGDISLGADHPAQAALKATDVPVTMLVSVQWQMKVSGLVNGTLDYHGNDKNGSARGQIAVNGARLNVMPWMGKVTALVGLPDISNVELDKATSDFEWRDRTLHLTNLDIRKNDVSRISGMADIDPTGQVDGRIKLGLPVSALSKLPPLQEKIFTVQQDNYNWADVHVTGTPDHLQEDLSPRLLALGMQEGGGLLDQAKQKATELLKSVLGN